MNFKATVVVFGALSLYASLCVANEELGLDRHNQLRTRHKSQLMKSNQTLIDLAESCAQDYAVRNAIDHYCSKTLGLGENLYWSSGWPPERRNTMDRAMLDWYIEKSDYNYMEPGAKRGVVGHFTQLVWSDSTSLGCGVQTVDGNTVACCLYYPQGNIGNGNLGADFYEFYKGNIKKPEIVENSETKKKQSASPTSSLNPH